MKLNYLAILGIAAVLTVGCAREINTNQPTQETQPATFESSPSASSAVQSGTFRAGEHPTQGTVRVVTDNGKSYLEFDQNFKTDNGSDLFVILHRSDAPPNGIKRQDYVNVGKLQQVSGTQRYALPTDVEPAEFGSVAIWCRLFNVTFGFAPLSG